MSGPRTFTVVIPTYNRAEYIRQAIDSVLAQTVQDVEIVVADDGSTDDTRERVAQYGNRVSYILTGHGGAAHARNVGMLAAHGKYLAFLDSDDELYPHMLEIEGRLLDLYPDVGFVYAEMSGFDDQGYFDRYHLKTYHESAYRDPRLTYDRIFAGSVRLGDLGILPEGLARTDPSLSDRRAYFGNIFDWYLSNVGLFTNNMLMRRALVPLVGLRNERVKYWEEFDYTLRISRHQRVCFVDVPTYKLRYHDGQISSTARDDGRYIWIRKQQVLLRVVKRQALEDAAYYRTHRAGIDRTLGQLHRAVAVPLMLVSGAASRDYARRARKYLARCRQYGTPHPGLWLATFTPGPVRRLAVTAVERLRGLRWRVRRTLARVA